MARERALPRGFGQVKGRTKRVFGSLELERHTIESPVQNATFGIKFNEEIEAVAHPFVKTFRLANLENCPCDNGLKSTE